MIINKFNIEKWMFDYFEDNLTMHERIEFERFLEANPQFESELELWEDSYSSVTDYPVYEVPSTLIKKSVFPNKTFIYALGLLLLLGSTVGIVSVLNEWNRTGELSGLTTIEQVEKEVTLNNDFSSNHTPAKTFINKPVIEEAIIDEEISTQTSYSSSNIPTSNKHSTTQIINVNKKSSNLTNQSLSTIKNQTSSIGEKRIQEEENSTKKLSPLIPAFEKSSSGKQQELAVKSTTEKELLNQQNTGTFNAYKMKALAVPEFDKSLVEFVEENEKSNQKYSYLDFQRNQKTERKKPVQPKDIKVKDRENNFWDNFALIGGVFYKNDDKIKATKKSKFLNKFKNKELALTNTHDPIFMKTNSNPIENNLALVGGLEMTRIKANVSNRWRSSNNEQNKALVTADTYFKNINAGVGLTASTKDINRGLVNNTAFGVTYSQRMQLKENSSVNIGVKYDYTTIHKNSFNIDNSVPLEFEQNRLMPFSSTINQEIKSISHNFSTAVWYDGQFLYGGMSLDNVKTLKKRNNNANEFVEYINPFKFAIQLGTDYRRSVYSALIISPQVNYSYELNNSSFWLGSSLKYKRFVTGIGVSTLNAYKVNMGIQGSKVRLIYAFDVSESKAEGKFYGTHEISFRYLLRGKNNWN